MAVKKMVVRCDCEVAMCDHARDEVGSLLQDTYDDAYDEGWRDAFESVRATLVDMGFEKASRMETPPPPPRKTKRRQAGQPDSPGNRRDLPN